MKLLIIQLSASLNKPKEELSLLRPQQLRWFTHQITVLTQPTSGSRIKLFACSVKTVPRTSLNPLLFCAYRQSNLGIQRTLKLICISVSQKYGEHKTDLIEFSKSTWQINSSLHIPQYEADFHCLC